MLNIRDMRIDPACLGQKKLLVDVVPVHEYRDNKRMDTVVAYRYIVALPELRLEKIGVKIDGRQLMDKPENFVEVEFDDNRRAQYTSNDLADLQLSYAITVHKSQGSEFDVAVIPLVNGPPTIINKNLLYTAITRAKKVVVLVGSKKVLAMMIHNNYIAARTTMLEWFLKSEDRKFDAFFGKDEH